MAFFSRETIRPEVVDTYGPYQDLTSKLDQSYDLATNRNAQRINQMYAGAGMSPNARPTLAAKARASTDLEAKRGEQGYQSYYDWLRGKQLAAPQVQPSGASQLAGPILGGMAYRGDIGRGLGNVWDWGKGAVGDWLPSASAYTATGPSATDTFLAGVDPTAGISMPFDGVPSTIEFAPEVSNYLTEATTTMPFEGLDALADFWAF